MRCPVADAATSYAGTSGRYVARKTPGSARRRERGAGLGPSDTTIRAFPSLVVPVALDSSFFRAINTLGDHLALQPFTILAVRLCIAVGGTEFQCRGHGHCDRCLTREVGAARKTQRFHITVGAAAISAGRVLPLLPEFVSPLEDSLAADTALSANFSIRHSAPGVPKLRIAVPPLTGRPA